MSGPVSPMRRSPEDEASEPLWKLLGELYASRSRSLASLYSFQAAGDDAEIVTPFLDPSNERIRLRVRRKAEAFLLCDLGLGGRLVDSAGRADGRAILEDIIRDFGLSESGGGLFLTVPERELLSGQFRLCTALVTLSERLGARPRR